METLLLVGEKQIKDWINAAIKDAILEFWAIESTNQNVEEPLISRKSAASILGISLVTLHSWIKQGYMTNRYSTVCKWFASRIWTAHETTKTSS
jgi:hypothetical protein